MYTIQLQFKVDPPMDLDKLFTDLYAYAQVRSAGALVGGRIGATTEDTEGFDSKAAALSEVDALLREAVALRNAAGKLEGTKQELIHRNRLCVTPRGKSGGFCCGDPLRCDGRQP